MNHYFRDMIDERIMILKQKIKLSIATNTDPDIVEDWKSELKSLEERDCDYVLVDLLKKESGYDK